MRPVLLTDAEAAARLGRSAEHVQRLRLNGLLPYLPGRPPLIDEADLLAYVDAKHRAAAEERQPPAPGTPEHEEMVAARMHRLALKNWHRRHGSRQAGRLLGILD